MTQEALKLALDALGNTWTKVGTKQYEIEKEAITAIKKALAQPEQEPWCMKMNGCTAKCEDCPDKPPPTPQRTWVGLTDEEQQQAYEQWQNDGWGVFYNAIEAKLKQKNG